MEVFVMNEKFESMKGYIREHKEDCIQIGLFAAVAIWGFGCGRFSVTQHVEAKTTWIDKEGLIVREQFIGIVR